MKKSFSGASAKPTPNIATKAEYLQRLRNRPKPKVIKQLTPKGAIRAQADRAALAQNKARMREIEQILTGASQKLAKGLGYSQQAGRTGHAFGKASQGRSR